MVTKETALEIVKSELGNARYVLCRARMLFHGMSEEQLTKAYGQSGETHKEALDGYEKRRDEPLECVKWVEGAETTEDKQ